MTTADLIAVMNAGRIEQLGTPQEVYEEPRSEFVAALPGRQQHHPRQGARRRPACRFAGAPIECRGAALAPGSDGAAVDPPARHRCLPASPGRADGNAAAGHGGPQRLPRRCARLRCRGRGRHPAARHGAAGRRSRRARGLGPSAAGALPRAGGVSGATSSMEEKCEGHAKVHQGNSGKNASRSGRSMRSSSAPASPASTSSSACATGSAFRCRCWRRATASAAPGTGTAIPARAAIRKATPTATRFSEELLREWEWSERYPGSRRSCATSTTSPTGST